ncbi:hypothetical protein DIX60_08725 [Streptococcus iniae]|uniref:hypothetical protein n=1 Tax=Streptococcus iniae TaxID=1346 RepID=UPI000EF66C22|nr:hypothetical protein [Streptococcus iniae]RLV27116.1 hypothetical protein DIX60_08725 [Streptococcus iniae]
MNKSIFKANFEESLNLLDDTYRNFSQQSYNDCIKFFKYGEPSLIFKLVYFVLSLIFPIGVTIFLLVISLSFGAESSKFVILNFYEILSFLLCLTLWLILILIGKKFSQQFIKIYRFQFHIQITSVLWFLIETNFLFFKVIYNQYDIYTVLGIVILLVFVAIYMIRDKRKYFQKILFTSKDLSDTDKEDTKLKILILIILVLTIGKIILEVIFGNVVSFLSSFSIVFSLLLIDLISLGYFIYITSSHFLPALYLLKYPEDYRLWEDKSVIDWYGKKYLKKHKGLLEQENKKEEK